MSPTHRPPSPLELLVGAFYGTVWCLWCLFQSPPPDYPKDLHSPSYSFNQSSSTWPLIKKPVAVSSLPTGMPLKSFQQWTDLIWLCFLKGYSRRSECTGMSRGRCEGCVAEMLELLEDPPSWGKGSWRLSWSPHCDTPRGGAAQRQTSQKNLEG